MNWVVKLGGSLNDDPLLPAWLSLLARVGRGRVVLVPGGGRYADEVRRAQARWQFDDLSAHNMAVLAMAQTACQWRALEPGLTLVERQAELTATLARGATALWAPLELRRAAPDARTHWQASSDTIALDLAQALACRLLLVKSCVLPPTADLVELAARGVVDAPLATLAAASGVAVSLLERDALDACRALLTAGS